MFKILLALHLLFAIFAVGPLVDAVTTASRGIRQGDATATASAARMSRIYAYASVLVVIVGFGLMSTKRNGKTIAEFGDTWIWLSVLLWVVAVGLTTRRHRAHARPGDGTEKISRPAANRLPRSPRASPQRGGVVALIFAGIVFLMVYRPGS